MVCFLFVVSVVVCFFFFSSRRRHTRFSRDWSSDVCSSDLFPHDQVASVAVGKLELNVSERALELYRPNESWLAVQKDLLRSEERRVGKECRSRWLAYV